MKKILLSLGVIAVVAIVAVSATGAFFSDTETSTGNTFTAGAIDLTVDSQQHYNNAECINNVWVVTNPTVPQYPVAGTACDGTWTATDLGASQKFFNFGDIKPGDSGENTISIHINNNDAWLRMLIKDVVDLDNSCTEPEEASSDTCTVASPEGTTPGAGELRESLLFTVFADANCNNIQDTGDATLISAGTIDAQGETWTLPTPVLGGSTTCFGITWDLPYSVGNETQTDSMGATVEFQVEQARNNPTPFAAPAPTLPAVGANLTAYVAPSCSVTVSGANSIQTAIGAASAGQTVCVDNTYDMTGDNAPIQVNKDITLAATTQGVNLDVPVVLAADGVTVTGFDGVIGQAATSAERAAFYVLGPTDNFEISFNTVNGGTGAGILTETGGTNNGGLIANNTLSGATQGIYTNPHTGTIIIEKNDINNNVAGIGGLMGATVRYNEFNHTTPGSEAMGVDNLSDSNPATVHFNNFLNGTKLNDYGAAVDVNAENNFWNTGGVNQTTATGVDFTPETLVQYAHN